MAQETPPFWGIKVRVWAGTGDPALLGHQDEGLGWHRRPCPSGSAARLPPGGAQWGLVSLCPEQPVDRTEVSLQGGPQENGLVVAKEAPGISPAVVKPCSGARGPARTQGCGPHTGHPLVVHCPA